MKRSSLTGRIAVRLAVIALLTFVAAPLAAALSPVARANASAVASPCNKIGAVKGRSAKRLVCVKVGDVRRWVPLERAPGALLQPTFATFFSPLGISLNWSPPRDLGMTAITGYRLEFQTAATPWLYALTFPASTYSTNIKDDRLAGSTYRFRVAAFNSAGVGVFSESNWVEYPRLNSGGSSAMTIPSSATTTATATATATTTTVTATQAGSVSQRNAASRAASYLRSSAFSRSGLIKQLEYEGFSASDATYGVDAQNADWSAQAVKKGASYLRSSSFSRTGLIGQLEYEGFSPSDAVYGTDAQNADWNAQAAAKAASYLRSSAFSRTGLIAQLEYEGFTRAQAEFGAAAVGL